MACNGEMRQVTDVIIIGGGVIGCSIAYYLRKAGIDVIVLEQGDIGAQASSAAAGLLAPLGPLSGPGPFADLLLASFALFPSLIPELEEVSGIQVGYEQTGALRIVRNPKRVANLKKRLAGWQPLGLQIYWLSGEEARQREPLLTPDIYAAIYAPEESQINAAHVVNAFSQAASNMGAKVSSHTKVTGIRQEKRRVTGVYVSHDGVIPCRHLILATGAWSAHYAAWFHTSIPVSPLKGQMICFRQSSHSLRHLIFGEAAYIIPRGEGILVGATKEEAGFDTQPTGEGITWLRETAIKLAPVLAQSTIQTTWAGLRPRTPDTRPILGRLPGWENVILATGHNSVGILLSPLTGKTVAECISTGDEPAIIRPFSLERFLA
jgi:glycine oxidase